jgi:hypothetical protein
MIEKCAICKTPIVFESSEETFKRGIHEYEICSVCERYICINCCEYDENTEVICSDCQIRTYHIRLTASEYDYLKTKLPLKKTEL